MFGLHTSSKLSCPYLGLNPGYLLKSFCTINKFFLLIFSNDSVKQFQYVEWKFQGGLRYFVIKQKRKRNKFSLKKFRKIRIFWWFQCHECIKGCLEFPGNDDKERQSYDGDFKDKKAHGKGLMRWRNGDKYEGEFKEGLRHGKGTYISKVSGFYPQERDKCFLRFILIHSQCK